VCVLTQMLGDALASMLEELESKKLKLTSLDAVKSAQNIYSSCFFEILRQVSVQCIERGNVLKAVWQCVPFIVVGLICVSQSSLCWGDRSYEKLFAKVSEAADEDLAALRAVIEQMKVRMFFPRCLAFARQLLHAHSWTIELKSKGFLTALMNFTQ
jgi:Axonemal dynein light chain